MCGIAGLFSNEPKKITQLDALLYNMNAPLTHRGPNGFGHWHDTQAGVGLAHRRLAILDLSEAGQQPMTSACGRFVITFNGEIYNQATLRKSLQPTVEHWRGHTDTEVLLHAISIWGLERALQHCVGMFAFALWDKRKKTLFLARDRMGEKPLYYGFWGNTFIFASELKAFQTLPDFHPEMNPQALSSFMRLSYIPAPLSIYEGIFKLPPAHILRLSAEQLTQKKPSIQAYWRLADVAAEPASSYKTDEHLVADLDQLLQKVISEQCVADVPVGTFLSGGIDSSLVTAMMQAANTESVRTFSIGFSENRYNEAPYAKAIAQYLGTKHTEVMISAEEAMAVVHQLPHIYDEPFADSSQIPTFLVSQVACQDVTVCLSGDGGDEIFGGYNRYHWARRFGDLQWCPQFFKNAMSQVIKTPKIAMALRAKNKSELYLGLTSICNNPARVLNQCDEPTYLMGDEKAWPRRDFAEQMMFVDALSYLPDDILTKVDRAAMAHSLETRIPFLDQRIVEFAWHLPPNCRTRRGASKWLLRSLLKQYVPERLFERPKMGFSIPLDSWLRGPLRGFAQERLSASALKSIDVFNTDAVQQLWNEHQAGTRNWQHVLWNVLMFQLWREAQESVNANSWQCVS
jgi:asparagine synthase (glutamine-hydrolysing)